MTPDTRHPTPFAPLLKHHRAHRRLTQGQLAAAIGIATSYISRLEAGDRNPSRQVVLDLAQALSLDDTHRDQLLAAARHLPVGDLTRILDADPALGNHTVHLVATAIRDQELTHRSRALLQNEITAYVAFRLAQLKQAQPILETA